MSSLLQPAVTIPTSGGGTLRATYLPPATHPSRAVLYVHGLGSHRGGEKSLAFREACEARGWGFLACDFRGHGESSGASHEMNGLTLMEDLAAARDFLAGEGVGSLDLVGSSMGGWAAAWFTHLNPGAVGRVVLLAPAFQFLFRRWNQLPAAVIEHWRQAGVLPLRNDWIEIDLGYSLYATRDRFPPGALTAGWRTPCLIFHGMDDRVVPHTESLDFAAACAFPRVEVRLFRDGDHRLTRYKDELAAEAARFFAAPPPPTDPS